MTESGGAEKNEMGSRVVVGCCCSKRLQGHFPGINRVGDPRVFLNDVAHEPSPARKEKQAPK
jgi:hypothetical protein